MENYYQIANLIVAVNGDNDVAKALKDEFGAFSIDTANSSDLYIDIVDDEKSVDIDSQYSSLSSKILFNKTTFRIKESDYIYSVENLFNKEKQTVLKIYFKNKSIRHLLKIFILPDLMGIDSYPKLMVESITNYSLLWYILALTLMKKDAVFVHGGMLEYKNRGIIFGGTSGCGKTSTMAELLNDDGKYIAEDFGVIDSNGNLYRIPKRAALYQSDLKYGNKHYIQAVKNLGFLQNMKWNVFSFIGKNPRGRFHAEKIFGNERVLNKYSVNTLIFLKRYSGNKVIFNDIPEEEYARRTMYAAFREIKIIYDYIYNIRAVGDSEIWASYPDLETLQSNYLDIIKKSISGVPMYEVEVPFKCAPMEITNELFNKFDKN